MQAGQNSPFGAGTGPGSSKNNEDQSEGSGQSLEAGRLTSTISPHYDDHRDIIMQMEILSDAVTKLLARIVWGSIAVGAALFLTGFILKLSRPESYFFQNNAIHIINVSFASLHIVALLLFLTYFLRRVIRSTRSGKRWSQRRLRGVEAATATLILQLINSILYLAPNARQLAVPCSWFEPFVLWTAFCRLTIWNTIFLLFCIQAANMLLAKGRNAKYSLPGRPDTTLMDCPWHVHWPLLLFLWLPTEGLILAATIVMVRHPNFQSVVLPGQSCTDVDYNCTYPTPALVCMTLFVVAVVVYFVYYVVVVCRVFNMLYGLPYTKFRMGNLVIRLDVRNRGISFAFFALTVVVFHFVQLNSCDSYIEFWFGLLPMQLVMTVLAIVNGFLMTPKRPGEATVLQVWLQEFAWTECDIPHKREERVSSLPPGSFEGFCMDCEPLFCFETAIKLAFWCFVVYQRGEEEQSPFAPSTALSLFGLDHFETVSERRFDSKAVVGWNKDCVVISFRGTSSVANVWSDLQAWRVKHPPAAKTSFLGTRVSLVHKGFLKAYTTNGFNNRLLGTVEAILNRCTSEQRESHQEQRPVQVFVTGHSLGGALAVLCAYDIATRGPCADYDLDVKCYTFGAPRVGNHTWAKLYNLKVPDTWQIINSDDTVTRAGKFLFLYKHVGHRVLLNRRGDLVVRPSFVEYSLRRTPGGSIKDHYLTSYQRALAAVVVAQFGTKAIGGGENHVLMLTEEEATRTALRNAGLDPESILQAAKSGSVPGPLQEVVVAPAVVGSAEGPPAHAEVEAEEDERGEEETSVSSISTEGVHQATTTRPGEFPGDPREETEHCLLQCGAACRKMRDMQRQQQGNAPEPARAPMSDPF